MAGIDRDQLDALKRQLEEEFRLDMAAIERIQSRVKITAEPAPAKEQPPVSSAVSDAPFTETRPVAPTTRFEPPPQRPPEELEGTLRSMFSSSRR